jgi:hypothetical protein
MHVVAHVRQDRDERTRDAWRVQSVPHSRGQGGKHAPDPDRRAYRCGGPRAGRDDFWNCLGRARKIEADSHLSAAAGRTCVYRLNKLKGTYEIGATGSPVPFRPTFTNGKLKLEGKTPGCEKVLVLSESSQ